MRLPGILKSIVAVVAVIGGSASAQTNPPYFIVSPQLKASATTKVEVVEVFSYACIHCAQFQNLVDTWRKRLDTSKVQFEYVPSPYNPEDVLLARGYYAARSLGIVEKTHQGVFQAIHERGIHPRTVNDVVSIYAQLGIPAEKFAKAVQDFSVDTQVRRTYDMMVKYKIDGTPTLIVNGKYRITADSAGSQENMIKVADQLIAQEIAQQKNQPTGTSRQAPSSGK